jgi:hypothetical protein
MPGVLIGYGTTDIPDMEAGWRYSKNNEYNVKRSLHLPLTLLVLPL